MALRADTTGLSSEHEGRVEGLVRLLRRPGTDLPLVEAKAAVGALPKSVRETLSAFSNDRGGLVLLGPAEESGFAPAADFDAAKTRDDLASLCSDAVEPPVRANVDIVDVEGAQIVVASVPEMDPGSKPCYVKVQRPGFSAASLRCGKMNYAEEVRSRDQGPGGPDGPPAPG